MSRILTIISGRLVRSLLVVVLAVASVGAVLVPVKAEAASCHVFTSTVAGSTDWGYYTPTYTVPSWSGCHDINVASINSSDHCAYMQVQFFPSSGGSTWGTEKYVCSTSLSVIEVLATNVANGTHYKIWVWYASDAMGVKFSYKIID